MRVLSLYALKIPKIPSLSYGSFTASLACLLSLSESSLISYSLFLSWISTMLCKALLPDVFLFLEVDLSSLADLPYDLLIPNSDLDLKLDRADDSSIEPVIALMIFLMTF